jgi:nucleoside-triphosphatase
MMAANPRNAVKVLVEGRPGTGKTTVAVRVAELLREAGIPVTGFVTREIRDGRTRVGFEIEDLDGDRAVLAHTRIKGRPRVGKYGVDLEAFERLAIPALADPGEGVIVIDELGKMELASERFRDRMSELIDADVSLIATVHAHRHPFTDPIKRRPDVELLTVTKRERDALPHRIVSAYASADRS